METSLPQPFPSRQLHDGTVFNSSPYPPHTNLPPQQDIALDDFQFDPQLANEPQLQHPQQRGTAFESNPFDGPRSNQPRFQEIRSDPQTSSPQSSNVFDPSNAGVFGVITRTSPQQNTDVGRGQFGILSPHPQTQSQLLNSHLNHDEQLGRLHNELDLQPVPVTDGGTTEGHFSDMKMIPNPPNLEQWRRKLFDVDDVIALSEDQ